MAIIPDVPGLEVEIVVKCTPLHEYVDQDEEGSAGTVTRYIEAVSGAEFAVQYRFSPDFEVKHALGIHVHVDGKNIASRVLKTRDRIFYGGSDLITGARSKEGGSFYISKFCFAALNIVDEAPALIGEDITETLKDVGTVSVVIRWVKISSKPRKTKDSQPTLSDTGVVPEKALKGRAISHAASLKGHESISSYRTLKTRNIGDGLPFATFNFQYRSIDALKSLHIIPRSPSPVPLEDRDVDSLTPEEMRELIKRQREREQAARKVKQERSTSVKREYTVDEEATEDGNDHVSIVSVKRRRRAPASGQAVIDLT